MAHITYTESLAPRTALFFVFACSHLLVGECILLTVEMVTTQDVISGVGAFYDEEGCQWQERGGSVVGCTLRG